MWWGPCTWYKNAVTTELFVRAVGIHDLMGDKRDLERTGRGWIWFRECGMINEEGLVNDGLTEEFKYPPFVPFFFSFLSFLFLVPMVVSGVFLIPSMMANFIDNRNNNQTTWTYNQGIILSGVSQLYKHTGDTSVLQSAINLIDSVISRPLLVPSDNGILVESRDPLGTCNQDQWMFKGVFFMHLGWFLEDIANMEALRLFPLGFLPPEFFSFWVSGREVDYRI